MFALQIIFKDVQKLNISSQYVNEVILSQKGKRAMLLAVQVAEDFHEGKDISFLDKGVNLGKDTDTFFQTKVKLQHLKHVLPIIFTPTFWIKSICSVTMKIPKKEIQELQHVQSPQQRQQLRHI